MERTPSALQMVAQGEELERLAKELSKCRADKEFVWGLWKKLQKTNPDLNAAIEMVMIREKEKHRQKIEQLLGYSEEKEGQLERMGEESEGLRVELAEERSCYQRLEAEKLELSRAVTATQSELSTAREGAAAYEQLRREHALLRERDRERGEEVAGLQQQLSSQELTFKSQTGQLLDRIRELVQENEQVVERAGEWEGREEEMQLKLGELGEQLQVVSGECARELEASRRLGEQLEQREREVEGLGVENGRVREELSECRGEVERERLVVEEKQSMITNFQASMTHKDDMLSHAHALNQELNDKISERDREISQLRQQLRGKEAEIVKLTPRPCHSASTQTSPSLLFQGSDLSLPVLARLLESRGLELEEVRRAHDRRQRRCRDLQAANRLLRQQLSTYAPDSVPARPVPGQGPREGEGEGGQRFLNQLTPPHTDIDTDQALNCPACKEVVAKYRCCQEECAQLAETVSSLEECVDELRCEKCHLETTLAELSYSAEREKETILVRLSSLRSVGSSPPCEEGAGFEECLLDLERIREEWCEEQQLMSEQLRAARTELAICKDRLRERAMLTSHHSCQTESALATSVSVQTTQQLLRRQYPPLRHASTQTPPPSPHPPSRAGKQGSELRSLQKRVSSLSRQTELLAEARSEAKSVLVEEQRRADGMKREREEMAYSLKLASAENHSLSAEALILRQENASLQAGLLERDAESSASLSRLEARLKGSGDECARQAGTLHRLNREAAERKREIESLTESAARKEREHRQNLAGKRHLIEEMREQLLALKSSKQSSEELVRKQACEVRRVSEASVSLGSKNASLKQQLEQARLNLCAQTEQLSLSQSECGRKELLLRAAKTQIDQLSQLFGEEASGRTEGLERRVACLRVLVAEYKQAILCVTELIWDRRCQRVGTVTKDILSLSTKEIMEVAKQGPDPVLLNWTDTSHYTQVVAAMEQQPPFARPLAELVISLFEL